MSSRREDRFGGGFTSAPWRRSAAGFLALIAKYCSPRDDSAMAPQFPIISATATARVMLQAAVDTPSHTRIRKNLFRNLLQSNEECVQLWMISVRVRARGASWPRTKRT
jgi:hypothetical protein